MTKVDDIELNNMFDHWLKENEEMIKILEENLRNRQNS